MVTFRLYKEEKKPTSLDFKISEVGSVSFSKMFEMFE
jgi:hypothetical protein